MRSQISAVAIVMVGLVWVPGVLSAQTSGANRGYTLVDLLVWGSYVQIDPNAYSPAVQEEIKRHLQRSQEYRSARRSPTNSSELEMVYHAQISYERRLVAATDDPRAPALAADTWITFDHVTNGRGSPIVPVGRPYMRVNTRQLTRLGHSANFYRCWRLIAGFVRRKPTKT